MTLWTAYFLGVGTTFLVLIVAWLLRRIAEPWAMALASGAPVGFSHILGMRIRKTDPRVLVGALVILTKSDEPISPFRLEAIYLTLPESERNVDNLVRAARQTVASTAVLEKMPAMDDSYFESSDAWLFLAIGYAAKHRTGSLADMLGMADGIQHAVPTLQEVNGAVGRLHRAGYLEEFNGQQLLPSDAGRELLDRVEAAGGTVFDKLDRLRQLIGARRWTTDYDPADAQRGENDVISPADLAQAVEAYSVG